MSEQLKQDTVPLYRVENPNISSINNGVTSHEDLVGQWFTPNIDTALNRLRKATSQTLGNTRIPVDGAQLVIAHLPADQLASYHVSEHPIAAHMDVESNNYIIPRDGLVPMDTIPLDNAIGDLRGKLGKTKEYREATERIQTLLGDIATSAK